MFELEGEQENRIVIPERVIANEANLTRASV